MPYSSPVHHGSLGPANPRKMRNTPKRTRYQATRSDTTYSVMLGQANVSMPASTPTTPITM